MIIKQIILCADDFGQNASVSEGILNLLETKRLNAVSCMVTGDAWLTFAKKLPKQSQVAIGLHLNFTHGLSLTQRQKLPSLLQLIVSCYKPKASFKRFVADEIQAQILRFKELYGQWPAFIDGHQHVHQLPVIRQALLHTVSKLQFKPWFRITASLQGMRGSWYSWKKWALLLLGGEQFKRLVQAQGFSTPTDFSGEYSFHQAKHFRTIFNKSVQSLKSGGLIMCHPGLESDASDDPIASSRYYEYQYFNSPVFFEDLDRLNSTLMAFDNN